MNKYNLDIPIYLNQKIVFDLLASINNGLAQVTKLKTSSTVGIEFSGGVDAELGNKNIFTLLGVNLKGKLENGKNQQQVLNLSQQMVLRNHGIDIQNNHLHLPVLFSHHKNNLLQLI